MVNTCTITVISYFKIKIDEKWHHVLDICYNSRIWYNIPSKLYEVWLSDSSIVCERNIWFYLPIPMKTEAGSKYKQINRYFCWIGGFYYYFVT